jgi:serine-aspartate repeat-containing protein C/D/E
MKLNQLLRPLTRRTKRQLMTSANKAAHRAVPQGMEALEKRQLMSAGLTIDIEVASTRGKTANVTTVGQVVNLDIIATVTGTTAGINQGLDSVDGSILSTLTDGSYSVGGNLGNATPTYEFTANGALSAASVDLNGDGYLDVGSNNNADIAGFFNARAGGIVTNGTISGDSNSFLIGTLTYTVDTLAYGQATDINFRLRDGLSAGALDAVWQQDGVGLNDGPHSGTVTIGAPVVITDSSLTAPPAGSVSGVVTGTSSGVSSSLSGVTMFLNTTGSSSYAAGDTTTTTNSAGQYDFTGLKAGTYYVGEELPAGYTLTTPSKEPIKVVLTTSQNLSGQDFIDAGTGAISGAVTQVVNGSSSAESGVTLYLDLNDSGAYSSSDPTVVTNSSGDYDFTGLAPGTYLLREQVPSGYKQTSPANTPTLLTITSGDNITGQNFTNTSTSVAATGSISGAVSKVVSGVTSADAGVTVYLDTNDNGALNSGEPSTTTSSTGSFSFTGLAAGTYYLREVVPTGYSQTSPSSSPTKITLASGQALSGQNFVDTSTVATYIPGSIAGTVYNDKNGNGKLDSGETGLSGVEMYIDVNKDGTIDSGDPTTTTSSTGAYSFTGLAPGVYRVREVVPSGDKLTNPTVGYYDITVESNWQITGENWGNSVPTVVTSNASIAGTVYKVVSGVTSADAGVTVYLDLKDSGSYVSGDPTTTTSATGTYSFTGLAAGTYYLRQTVPTGYAQTSPSSSPTTVTLTAGKAVTGENFTDTAATVASTGSITGEVYSDANDNGKLDSGEVGISGVTVYLDINKDGKYDSGDIETTTNSSGVYSFTGLPAGTYSVRETLLSGDSFTSPSSGALSVTLASGAKVTAENFGNTGPLTLPGIVFSDANGDGKQDGTDAGLGGWVVYCDLNHNGVFVSSDNNKTTASNGTFSFVSLKAGTYTLRVVAKSGYTLTSPSSGYYTVVLEPGVPVTGINFAEEPTAKTAAGTANSGAITLSGTVFNDLAGTGVQTANDPGLAGWVVYVDLKDTGTFVASDNNKTTLSNGTFEFVSLTAGTYIIRVVPEAGYAQTLPNDGFYTVTLAPGDPVSIAFGEHVS